MCAFVVERVLRTRCVSPACLIDCSVVPGASTYGPVPMYEAPRSRTMAVFHCVSTVSKRGLGPDMVKTTRSLTAATFARPNSAFVRESDAAASSAVNGVPSEKTMPCRTAAE
ncbi:MAG TPA: hypothetical protein VEK79_07295 [Thermoanaerobaculia bacterium]|nr:hypothetical protein [Thermoanaerobaculia bacterium]